MIQVLLDDDISHLLGLQHSPPNMRLSPEKHRRRFAALRRVRWPRWRQTQRTTETPRYAAGIHNGSNLATPRMTMLT